MNWDNTRCEGEQEERIQELSSDGHIQKIIQESHLIKDQHPEAIIFYQITCGGCESRLTDDDPLSLAVDYQCDECDYVTRTVDGNLGHVSVVLPPGLRD
jgi:hypothetical protein